MKYTKQRCMTISANAHSLKHILFHRDRVILTVFALYGFIMGIILYVDAVPPRDLVFLSMNFPVMLLAAFMEIYMGSPQRAFAFHPVMVIPLYTILWLFIGLLVYGIVRMLRLDSTTTSN